MGNGKWEPDPSDVECRGESIVRITQMSFDSFEPLNQEGKIAVASSVTVITVASILLFTIGFCVDTFVKQKKR